MYNSYIGYNGVKNMEMDIGVVIKLVLRLFIAGMNSSNKVKISGELEGKPIQGVAKLCKDGSIQINFNP
jgi:hypothetical protein